MDQQSQSGTSPTLIPGVRNVPEQGKNPNFRRMSFYFSRYFHTDTWELGSSHSTIGNHNSPLQTSAHQMVIQPGRGSEQPGPREMSLSMARGGTGWDWRSLPTQTSLGLLGRAAAEELLSDLSKGNAGNAV